MLGNGGYVTLWESLHTVCLQHYLFIYLRYILGVNKRDEIILLGDIQFLTIYLFLRALCFTCVYACVRVLLQIIVSHHVGAEH